MTDDRNDGGTSEPLEGRPRFDWDGLTLVKADALDLALVGLEAMDGAGDGSTRASEERRPSEVGVGPADVLVPLDQMIPQVGELCATARATAPLGSHGWRGLADGSQGLGLGWTRKGVVLLGLGCNGHAMTKAGLWTEGKEFES